MQRVVTEDEADWEILKLANSNGKFAIELGLPLSPELQKAFERGLGRWYSLIDVSALYILPHRICRIFCLTQAGRHRKERLAKVFDVANDANVLSQFDKNNE